MVRPWTSGDHVCIQYHTENEYRRLVRFHLLAALERGQKITYLTDRAPPEVLLAWLSLAGSELDALTRRGQLAVLSADEFYLAEREFEPHRVISRLRDETSLATRAGYTGLHISADMTWALRGLPNCDPLVDYEKRVTDLVAAGELPTLTAFCVYDQRQFTDGWRPDALGQAHSIALTVEQAEQREPLLRMTSLEGQRGLRVSGEIDRSNLAEFAATLKQSYCDNADFYLDVAELHYADVAAVRLLARSAADLQSGYRFVLRSPGPIIRAILRNYGWDELPSLKTVDAWEVS